MPAETFDDARPPAVAVVDLDRRVQLALAEAMRAAGVDVVGTAGDISSALELLDSGARVMLVDPRLPDIASGQALMSTISRDWPGVRIVIMGWGDSGESAAMVNCVCTFISKSASPEEFVAAALEACATT
jgi:DNA-binding NtrC family response regulator